MELVHGGLAAAMVVAIVQDDRAAGSHLGGQRRKADLADVAGNISFQYRTDRALDPRQLRI